MIQVTLKFRCQYKIATLAYRHFEGSLPSYLSSSLCTYEPSHFLRSSNEKLLKIPKQNLKSFEQRSFSFMAPSLWNSLPATLRNVPTLSQFKSQLKTFLFAQAFLQNPEMNVKVVFVIRCLYSTVSLTLVKEQRFIRIIYCYYLLLSTLHTIFIYAES